MPGSMYTLEQLALRRQTPFVRTLYGLGMFDFVFWRGSLRYKNSQRAGQLRPTDSRNYPYAYRMRWNYWNPLVLPYLLVCTLGLLIFGTVYHGFKELPQIAKEIWQHAIVPPKRDF